MNSSFEMCSGAPQGTSYRLRVESDASAAGLFVSGECLTVLQRAANIRRCMYQKQPLLTFAHASNLSNLLQEKSKKQFQFTASIGIVSFHLVLPFSSGPDGLFVRGSGVYDATMILNFFGGVLWVRVR
jgi:hypothetical protein